MPRGIRTLPNRYYTKAYERLTRLAMKNGLSEPTGYIPVDRFLIGMFVKYPDSWAGTPLALAVLGLVLFMVIWPRPLGGPWQHRDSDDQDGKPT